MSKNYEKSFHRQTAGPAKKAKSEENKTPRLHCQTCLRLKSYGCEFFHRHVVEDYNRCLFHSDYLPYTEDSVIRVGKEGQI